MPSVSELIAFKPARTALLLGAVAGYGVVCALMAGPAAGSGNVNELYLLLAGWVIGLGVLLVLDHPVGRFGDGGLTMVKALWLNLGVVASSLFVAPDLRLLLLTVPLFGVLYAALHLDRRRVAQVTGITWLGYLTGTLVLLGGEGIEAPGEGRLVVAFSAMLLAMFFMASEVTALRRAFERRRLRLDAAMQKLADLAMRDDLTGLYNRRYVMEVLARQKALADRGHVGFTLCYCDLDHFKRINDRFGHQCGDDVLREFGALTGQVVRSVDFVARFGGEEFLLVLVDADAEEARRVAARLGDRTRALLVAPHHPDFRLSVSVGIAEFTPGESLEDVIQRADRALYQAKSSGRDLVIVG
ncbi:MAG: GGDEF domain-containing protein [Pseudomonadales bacterium]